MNTNLTVPAPRTRRRTSAQVLADRRLVGQIRASLASNPAAVVRALELLFGRQTEDERAVHVTHHTNERGFSQADAGTGSWLVETVIAEGRAKGRLDADCLRGKALSMGLRIASKYARTQLLGLAKAKSAAVAYEVELSSCEAECAHETAPVAEVDIMSLRTESGGIPYFVTARLMAGPNPSDEEGAFWDSWKNRMKESY